MRPSELAKNLQGRESSRLAVYYPAMCGEMIRFAALELARLLTAAMGESVAVRMDDNGLCEARLRLGPLSSAAPAPPADVRWAAVAAGDCFALWREAVTPGSATARRGGALVLAGGTERAVLHAAYELVQKVGVRFPVAGAAAVVRRGGEALERVEPFAVAPAFSRRALVADIMTWHYETPERLATHLAHDREFVTWMAARGLNAFSYIRHPLDNRLKIDELVALYRERGIGSEYGGHVLQLLLPRARFDTDSNYFPVGTDGKRNSRGNLCTANPRALDLVREAALRYVRDNPECEVLHVWGADVREGAWCRCAQCTEMSPQLQYMKVVNAIADGLGDEGPPVAYLAYHDTLEPDVDLRPRPNAWFEWAPRERCYRHAIDDPVCAVNPHYLESLKGYIDLFQGRGHVFEYYADAVLFGGLACATPAIIARDLRAYRALGLTSVSCLTFGMHSALAYPLNLETFARATRSPDFEPEHTLADIAATLHPACGSEMTEAYRAIARASALILNGGGNLMRPQIRPAAAARERLHELKQAHGEITRALDAADRVAALARDALGAFEREVWIYSRDVISGIAELIEASAETGADRGRRGGAAIKAIGEALDRLHSISPAAHDTWANWDVEWIRGLWLDALRRRFYEN
jgi:uncharacterized protein DUF4838